MATSPTIRAAELLEEDANDKRDCCDLVRDGHPVVEWSCPDCKRDEDGRCEPQRAHDERLQMARQLREAWRPMVDAPLDGTELELLVRHPTWWTAVKCDGQEKADKVWQGAVRGKWIDHNGGGWTWHGHNGTPVGWRQLPIQGSESR